VRGYDIYKLLRCYWRKSFARFGPGFWGDILNLPVGHGRQPGEDIAEVSVGFDTVAAAALNDRVDDRATSPALASPKKSQFFFLWKAFHKKKQKNYEQSGIMQSWKAEENSHFRCAVVG
jgi:hypothetical protein